MFKRNNNSILTMFTTINKVYTELSSGKEKELGIEIVGHALMIQDNPLHTGLFFQVDNNGGIVVQKYDYTEGEECFLESVKFGPDNIYGPSSIENYIIDTFEL